MGGGDVNIESQRSIIFMKQSGLGIENRRRFQDRLMLGFRSKHYWLWDYESSEKVLQKTGFKNIRPCTYHDSQLSAFESVEDINRFQDALAIEAIR
jgi:hypothetical protein